MSYSSGPVSPMPSPIHRFAPAPFSGDPGTPPFPPLTPPLGPSALGHSDRLGAMPRLGNDAVGKVVCSRALGLRVRVVVAGNMYCLDQAFS